MTFGALTPGTNLTVFFYQNGLPLLISILQFISCNYLFKMALFVLSAILLGQIYSKLSNIQLIEKCTRKSPDWENIWMEFEHRFGKAILFYLIGEFKRRQAGKFSSKFKDVVKDLRQDIYIKLLQREGQGLKNFKGQNENSFYEYLKAMAVNTVKNYMKHQNTEKRAATVVSLDNPKNIEVSSYQSKGLESEDNHELILIKQSMLQVLREHFAGKNVERDLMIFEQFYFENRTSEEINLNADVNLKLSGIETVINRMKHTLIKYMDL